MLDLKFFLKVAPKIRDKYREHIFGADASASYIKPARDIDGKKFKQYSTKYGQRKRADKFARQASSFKNSTNPVLTTDLLRDYGMIGNPTSTGFQIGWSIYGAVVRALEKMGRVLTRRNKPLPDNVLKILDADASKYNRKKLNKRIPNKTTRHKIGK